MNSASGLPVKRRRRMSYWFLGSGCILLLLAGLIGISDNLPGILALLLGSLGLLLGIVFRFAGSGERTAGQQLLYWTPRALTIVFALFVAIFALDVFGAGKPFWETLLAFLIHLIPAFLLFAVLALSWRHEWIGGIVFIALALFYIVSFWGRFVWSVYALMAGPLVVIGVLFLINWQHRGELHAGGGKTVG